MSDLAHKTINNINKPIERGIDVNNDVADIILSGFKIGEMVEIPDDSGHGSSGFSLSGEKARYFSKVHNDESDQTSILFRIEPNSKGQIRGLYVDGDEHIRLILNTEKKKLFVVLNQKQKLFQ